MKSIYEASNTVEAHMILNLLSQEGIEGRVVGEFLQGGVGELPAQGLVRVHVHDDDVAAARRIIDRWEAKQPAPSQAAVPAPPESSRIWLFPAGLLVGVVGMYFLYWTTGAVSGADYNKDGRLDDVWRFTPTGVAASIDLDRNLDGKVDSQVLNDRDGFPDSGESDEDFNGTFDTRWTYRYGGPATAESDFDLDGKPETRTIFQNGVIERVERFSPGSGRPSRIEHYKNNVVEYAEIDSNMDGAPDSIVRYDAIGREIPEPSRER